MKSLLRCSLLAVALLLPNACSASIWTLNIGGAELSNSGSNDIADDAIVLTFDDSLGPNQVRLTIDFQGGTGVDPGAFLNDLVFNVDDALTGLTFSYVSGVATQTAPTYSMNGKSLSPENGFDIEFDFPPPGPNPRLFVGMTSVYDIFATGLNANSFDYFNLNGMLKAYVHINAVDDGNSGKYGDTPPIPEPTTLVLWATAMAGALCIQIRRRA